MAALSAVEFAAAKRRKEIARDAEQISGQPIIMDHYARCGSADAIDELELASISSEEHKY
ncbi:predicted protein [Coccidioides posadasii str. Silveira]|uniref:Predicted protein n=1 Tax=Coccidioides posadasii (strain RMSCC 757 / Silveira) TaxID=443226 RepID=E9D3F3_COCPS|nr:predicted protein [Coccidioides posadasii str. Silveira]